MKPRYFDQPAADQDDRLLQEHILAGAVPATCLLGGANVGASVKLGLNPCSSCAGPRERCGGSGSAVGQPTARRGDDADARAIVRKQHIATMHSLMQKEKITP